VNATAYSPAHDPDFPAAFLRDLLAHPGEWRHAGRAVVEERDPESELLQGGFGAMQLAEYSYRAAQLWRSRGHVIEGSTVLGYRWVDVKPPRPFGRTWADLPVNVRSHKRAPMPLQMTIEGAV
jgi:hypothetical protein